MTLPARFKMFRLLSYKREWIWTVGIGNLDVLCVRKWRHQRRVFIEVWEEWFVDFRWSPWCRLRMFRMEAE